MTGTELTDGARGATPLTNEGSPAPSMEGGTGGTGENETPLETSPTQQSISSHLAVQGVYCEPVSVQSLFSGKIQRKSVESTGKVRLPCRNLPELLSFFPLSEHPSET